MDRGPQGVAVDAVVVGDAHALLGGHVGDGAQDVAGRVARRAEAGRAEVEDGDPAVGALLERRRDTDAQAIRQLLRNARREAERGKPPAAARSLFRLLRDMDLAEALPPLPES